MKGSRVSTHTLCTLVLILFFVDSFSLKGIFEFVGTLYNCTVLSQKFGVLIWNCVSASINAYGSQCPVALRLVACILLLEVTAFLRETYQTLPKFNELLTKEHPQPRETIRRWSMALSSMGHSQTSAQSLQSIVGK